MRRRGQQGSATVFLLGFATVLLVGAGLVIDGGLALNGRQRIADDAEQASRYGANAIDENALRDSGAVRVDPDTAVARATSFMADRGYRNIAVAVDGDKVTTSAEGSVETALLSLVGIKSFTVRGDATAEAVEGR
ncbi:pilus assembly protein TadG-related protein [Kribbella solani]|uniref:Flp pilus assembly protein TadG n=1 Tax=Kribbella solani TaxID=236067 RepID=A0A841DUP3_9ACTN|nr:pilus assembly protein TadG-related protein [Kribbella solani]MBB5979997.1 Flp pilus assembly protein TadG [Kribbella solani]MDX3007071.1 pilus assembly protein TadG-related protein [Kribbella solani]